MLNFSSSLKFVIIYYKFKKNNSKLIFNNNIIINLPILLKTNQKKNCLYFYYNKSNDLNLNINIYNYKKLYQNILLNILYSLHKNYLITLLLVDKNKDGYKILLKDNVLSFKLGKSHDLIYNLPSNFKIKLGRKAKSIKIYSNNLQDLISFVLNIRKHRLPEPYKGKGVLFKYEKIKRKKIRKLRSIKNFKKKRKK